MLILSSIGIDEAIPELLPLLYIPLDYFCSYPPLIANILTSAKLAFNPMAFPAPFNALPTFYIFISPFAANNSFNMIWDMFYPSLDLLLRQIFPCLNPLCSSSLFISWSSKNCSSFLYLKLARFNHIQIRRISRPKHTHNLMKIVKNPLSKVGMRRGIIFLNDGVWTLPFTLLSKGDKLWDKDLLIRDLN